MEFPAKHKRGSLALFKFADFLTSSCGRSSLGSGDARENIAVNIVGSEVSGTRAVFAPNGSALVFVDTASRTYDP